MRRMLLGLAVALAMAAVMAVPSAGAQTGLAQSEWCYGGTAPVTPGANCFTSWKACEDIRQESGDNTSCEHFVAPMLEHP
jgi:hypothetical protein